ncbi:MAG: hypothetical protein SGI90_05030 [Candidatus Eisenbacteria bacterium]|nr:hypothetical protein [Candidatus Eisenbacteria bacterium]
MMRGRAAHAGGPGVCLRATPVVVGHFLRTVAILLLVAVPRNEALAQGCCTPGTGPLSGLRAGGLLPGQFRVGLAWDQFDLNSALRGSDEVQPLTDRQARYARLVAQLEVGLPSRARLAVELPWEFRRREVVLAPGVPNSPTLDLENRAPGDLTTTLLVEIAPRSATPRPWAIDLGGGIKWATGPTDRTDDERALPPELQSGTGSTDPLFVLAARRSWTRVGLVGTTLYRFTQANDTGYRFGSEFDVTLAGWLAATDALSLGLDARWRSAERDEFLDIERPNSGGRRLMVGPRVAGRINGADIAVEASYLAPVYQDLNGTQLGVDSEWTLGLSWSSR